MEDTRTRNSTLTSSIRTSRLIQTKVVNTNNNNTKMHPQVMAEVQKINDGYYAGQGRDLLRAGIKNLVRCIHQLEKPDFSILEEKYSPLEKIKRYILSGVKMDKTRSRPTFPSTTQTKDYSKSGIYVRGIFITQEID